VKGLDAYLAEYEFSERHRIAIAAPAERIDTALREVTFAELPLVRVLFALRGLGRREGRERAVAGMAGKAVVLEDEPGTGLVLGLTGQFWRPGGGDRSARARTPAEFLTYERRDACQAVVDFRASAGELTTETRVHVRDPAARRRFRRYWLLVRPFSGSTRLLLLRAAKRRAEA
jgi:hypothetical protein